MKHRTGPCPTRLLETVPNQGLHCQTVMQDLCFSEILHSNGTAYQSHVQGSRNPKDRIQHDWN